LDRKELRLRILFRLYIHHYENIGNHVQTEQLRNEEEFKYTDPKQFFGDIIYLNKKGLITGTNVTGILYPYSIAISPTGMELIEYVMDFYKSFLQNHGEKSDDKNASTLFRQLEAVENRVKFTEAIRNFHQEFWKRDNSKFTKQFLSKYELFIK
jgi:hypothetical protein